MPISEVVIKNFHCRYCKEYRGSGTDVKFVEEDPDQERACKEADGFVSKSNSERLDLLLVTNSDDKENVGSKRTSKMRSVDEEISVVENMDLDDEKKVFGHLYYSFDIKFLKVLSIVLTLSA